MSKRSRNRKHNRAALVPVQAPKPPTAPRALVDIVMPIFGEWALAEKALDALAASAVGLSEGYRVIVVDNGTPAWEDAEGKRITPQDQAIAVKDRLRPGDVFFRIEENEGYPRAVNKAAARGVSPLLLILTADVYLMPGAISAMVRGLDDPQVGVVGPLLLFPEGTKYGPSGRVQHAGISFDIRGKTFHHFIGWTPENPRVNKPAEVSAVTGACLMTRRNLWNQIGGFAEVYGKGTYEDMEYCFAVRQGGAKVLYLPSARGYHVVGGSMQAGANRSGFALPVNETIFRGRWQHMLMWDEWRRW
jgi:GT2 family glycosyltransferase